jgi:hypothetical protein
MKLAGIKTSIMTRGIHKLTARAVMAINKPGRHADGGNLYLQISQSGTRQWTFFLIIIERRLKAMEGKHT